MVNIGTKVSGWLLTMDVALVIADSDVTIALMVERLFQPLTTAAIWAGTNTCICIMRLLSMLDMKSCPQISFFFVMQVRWKYSCTLTGWRRNKNKNINKLM